MTARQRVDATLARLRPHRHALSLVVDAAVIAVCWQLTYLFRLGFERWLVERPDYDGWVLLGVTVTYLAVLAAAGVPRALWRFTGFGEVKRLTLACLLAEIGRAHV